MDERDPMSKPFDRSLARWAAERRQERQATNSHKSFVMRFEGEEDPLPGGGGIELESSDLDHGVRRLELTLRPVLLGFVEWHVKFTTTRPGATKPHVKKSYIYSSPEALRELAAQLLETADEAEKKKLRPRPIT